VTATLYSIHHSPWSERARWALLHHEIPFDEKSHVPLIGELALRRRAKVSGKVSVPLLVDDDGVATQGSLAIGERVDERGAKSPLFPKGAGDRIRALYDELEDALSAARARHVQTLGTDREARLASLPPFLRKLPFSSSTARLGIAFITRKYGARPESVDDRMRAGLLAVRDALGDRPYVLDAFSFADILAASVVQTVDPVDDVYIELPPPTRRAWTHDTLRAEFSDLVAWRNRLYRDHRPIG
jgi:glutathione S-transferase